MSNSAGSRQSGFLGTVIIVVPRSSDKLKIHITTHAINVLMY